MMTNRDARSTAIDPDRASHQEADRVRGLTLPATTALVVGTVIGTGVGDLAYYLGQARADDDWHGLGAFLIMNEEFRTSRSSMEQTVPAPASSRTAGP